MKKIEVLKKEIDKLSVENEYLKEKNKILTSKVKDQMLTVTLSCRNTASEAFEKLRNALTKQAKIGTEGANYIKKQQDNGYVLDEGRLEFRELNLEEICYKAESVEDLFVIYKSIPKELFRKDYDLNMDYPYIIEYKGVMPTVTNGITNCVTPYNRKIVNQKAFIQIANKKK